MKKYPVLYNNDNILSEGISRLFSYNIITKIRKKTHTN